MKYQFQFAGVNTERRVPPQKKRLRLVLLIVAFALAVLAYANYLYSLAHGQKPFFAAIGHPAPPPPIAAQTAPNQKAEQLPSALKTVTESGIAILGSYLSQTIKSAQPTPATAPQTAPPASVTVTKPQTATVEATGYQVVSEPAHRLNRVHTAQERLLRAGQIAFGNVMQLVSKYPDAYGFGVEDSFSNVKLGDPIPVYTIQEEDRARYQAGQPVKPMLKPMDQWVFPVIAGTRICCMVQVSYTGHDYVPDNGSKLLGLAWNKILEKWPASEGYHPYLVVTPSVPGFYFTIPELASPNLTDIVQMFYYRPTLSPADVILASWR